MLQALGNKKVFGCRVFLPLCGFMLSIDPWLRNHPPRCTDDSRDPILGAFEERGGLPNHGVQLVVWAGRV